jgi:predicted O-linked N-acetylglucosamine transferase (SPINDLY family)
MASIREALQIALEHQRAGRLDLAGEIYRRILQAEPDQAEAHNNLGVVLHAQGSLDEATACYRRAIAARPDLVEAHNNLANALQEQGERDAAIVEYRRAIDLRPDYPEAHNNLGAVLRARGFLDEALTCSRRAVELRPGMAEAHSNLADTLRDLGRTREAIACYQQALQLKPGLPAIHVNLGMALHDLGRLDDAAASYCRAIRLQPDNSQAHSNLGIVLKEQGELDVAAACYEEAVQLDPDSAAAHSNFLLCQQFRPGVTPAQLAEAHAEWDRRHARPLQSACPAPANDRDPDRPLRLGFVSPDFGRHPVGWFLVRVIEELRGLDCHTVCYSDRALGDEITARFQRAAGTWREVRGLSHARLADQIRADRIDILFDLAGHTANTRLLVFARRPAPIQATWLGYVGTTGLSAMDYLVADRWQVPEAAEPHYCETVLRLPDGYTCYDPPAYAPPVDRLPALACGHVTFGCFNAPAKIASPVFQVWMQILRRLPQARLVLKYHGMDDPGVVRRIATMLAWSEIDPARVELQGGSPHAELLDAYRHIDLALDPAPYSGGLTTCEALWMGVPVITCPGATFAGRHSLSHLSSVGLTETIARDFDHYVDLAVALAGDLPRLAALRAAIRPRMAQSPLCDGKRLAGNLIGLLRPAWRRWCQSAGADGRSSRGSR